MKRLPAASATVASGQTQRATPAPTASDIFAARATTVVSEIVTGKFAAVGAQFDPALSAQLSKAQLVSSWRSYEVQFGAF